MSKLGHQTVPAKVLTPMTNLKNEISPNELRKRKPINSRAFLTVYPRAVLAAYPPPNTLTT